MPSSLTEIGESLRIATEALSRYKLRTLLSVLGVILGVAAVIAMMSVGDGARRESLKQMEALGLDNLVVRSNRPSVLGTAPNALTAGDAGRLRAIVPLVASASPLIERYGRLAHGSRVANTRVLGVRSSYREILRLQVDRGRFLAPADERTDAMVCVLGASLARQLFGYRDPLGQQLRVFQNYYTVVGVLRERGVDPKASGAFSWRNVNDVAMVPLPALSERTLAVEPNQATDEIWLQVTDGERVTQLARILDHALERLHGVRFEVVVPRELLAQRYRTQQTFSIVVGSIAALALTVGGIGIMNIMLTSVVERTHEIGIRRAMGATRRDITSQFLIEALLMTSTGGLAGIASGIAISFGITAYAGWSTYVSAWAVALGLAVSCLVGLIFGSYPAIKAATLAPVDALRYE